MTPEERTVAAGNIVRSLHGHPIHDCLAVVTEVIAAIILAISIKDNQQLKCAIVMQNFVNKLVELLMSNTSGGNA